MNKIINSITIVAIATIIAGCVGVTSVNNQNVVFGIQSKSLESKNYLIKPTGSYGVGFQDLHFQDNNRCPDIFYSKFTESTEAYYNKSNINHCREIIVRVYYPSNRSGASGYYPIMTHLLAKDDVTYSYTQQKLKIASGKFPVVIFVPGNQAQTQLYENFITNLVSYGYVVVGVNSPFIDANILVNRHLVPMVEPYTDAPSYFNLIRTIVLPTATKDLEFIYNQLQMNKILSNNIENPRVIGAIGHSIGSEAIRQAVLKDGYKFSKIITLDLSSPMGDPYNPLVDPNIGVFTVPILNIGSAGQNIFPNNAILTESAINVLKNNLGNLGSLRILTTSKTDNLYTKHMNLSDYSTLQYSAIIESQFKLDGTTLGVANGCDITRQINDYILSFMKN